MKAPLSVRQKVTVEIDRYDSGLRTFIADLAGAPRRSYPTVRFHETGVTVTWDRKRKLT